MRKGLFLLLLSLVYLSCQEPIELPMEEDKLVMVLRDIHIAEAGIAQLTGTKKDTTAKVVYKQIYTMYGVEEATFDSTLAALKKDPERMKMIYEKVMEALEKLDLEAE